jgi:CBS domain-containing protein
MSSDLSSSLRPGLPAPRSLSARFISTYNRLDLYLRTELQADIRVSHGDLLRRKATKSNDFQKRLTELQRFAELRNSIVHWEGWGEANTAIAEPHQAIVERYESMVERVLTPLRADQIWIPRKRIFTATLADGALPVIRHMCKLVYTHVPILDGDKLIGIFSESTVLAFLANHECPIVEESTMLLEFAPFLTIEADRSERFAFVKPTAFVSEVVDLFQSYLQKKERLGAVLVTATGRPTGELMGLITAWDIAGSDPESSPVWF